MISVQAVTKKYGKYKANDDLNFTVDNGSITVLLGPNGAGKSTIIKSITGFLKYEGTIQINGFDNHSIQAKRDLAYVPEMPALYKNLTVQEHLEFIARAYKLKDYSDYAKQLLERFELADKKEKFGDELSKGMQQKLSICCAFLLNPKDILMDEPMIGLDPHAIKEVKLLLEEMRAKGCSIMISTHMIDSVDMLWDHTLIMQQGKIAANINRKDIEKSKESLEEIFFRITEGGKK